jgi:hypothetical protein
MSPAMTGKNMRHPHPDIKNTPQSSNDPTGCEIVRRSAGRFALKIWGRLPPNWLGALSSGLSRSGISIISGNAQQVKTTWQAEFEIIATRAFTDLNRIDFLSLAQEALDTAGVADISLDAFVLDDDLQKYDGALYL